MSAIVYTKTTELRDGVPSATYGRIATDSKVTIFQSRDKVAVVNSSLVVGAPNGNKTKRYYRWRTVGSTGFRRSSLGNIIPYQCHRRFDAKRSVPWTHRQPREPFQLLLNTQSELGRAFKHAVWDTFDVEKQEDIYPMMQQYNLLHYWTIPNSLLASFRVDDWTEYTARAFGKTRTTPRLIAAVQQTEPYIVAYAQQFRGLVDDDKVVAFIERNHFDEEMENEFQPHSPNIRSGLLHTSQSIRDGLIMRDMSLEEINRVHLSVSSRGNMEQWLRKTAMSSVSHAASPGLIPF